MTATASGSGVLKRAIHSDCMRLIENFAKASQTQMSSFFNEWKLMAFQHIYSGQLNDIDIVQITMEAFLICKRLLVQERPKLEKIGAIYLIYCLYYKQPTEFYAKICVNMETWISLRRFIDSIDLDNDCIQIRYIFWKLASDNAFRFVESDICYGLEPFFNKEQDYAYHSLCSSASINIFRNEMVDMTHNREGLLKGFDTLQQRYNSMKTVLNKTHQTQTNYAPIDMTDFFGDIKSGIDSISQILYAKSGDDMKDSKIDIETIRTRRMNIKQNAFAFTETETDTPKNNKKERQGFGKLSIKQLIQRSKDIPATTTSTGESDLENQTATSLDDVEIDDLSENCKNIRDPLGPDTRRMSKLLQIQNLLSDNLPDELLKELGATS